jgi:hypothetical protein
VHTRKNALALGSSFECGVCVVVSPKDAGAWPSEATPPPMTANHWGDLSKLVKTVSALIVYVLMNLAKVRWLIRSVKCAHRRFSSDRAQGW